MFTQNVIGNSFMEPGGYQVHNLIMLSIHDQISTHLKQSFPFTRIFFIYAFLPFQKHVLIHNLQVIQICKYSKHHSYKGNTTYCQIYRQYTTPINAINQTSLTVISELINSTCESTFREAVLVAEHLQRVKSNHLTMVAFMQESQHDVLVGGESCLLLLLDGFIW